jgi:hypothetical protein
MDLLSGDLQWGKMMGKPSWWGRKAITTTTTTTTTTLLVLRTELDLQFICMEFVSWVDCKILLCWFCPANLQGIFHHWFHNFEDLLPSSDMLLF